MNKKFSLLALFASFPLYAGTMGSPVNEYPWFASIGTGYSWTEKSGITNPQPSFWDDAIQGYNGNLGNRGFYTFAVGKQVYRYIDLNLSYLDHENFNYQQFQTGGSSTPGFTGNARTRYFTLDNRALLISGSLHPAESIYSLLSLNFTPFVGAGIGYAYNQVRNFYTIGTATIDGVTVGSTTSIGNPANRNSFAWQGSVGLNIQPQISHLSVDIGYRYFDGGKFNGPSTVYTNASGFLTGLPWLGRLEANQAFVAFKYTV